MKNIVNFSVDKKVCDDFKQLAKDKSINMSSLIEAFLKKWVEDNSLHNDLDKILKEK
jgi:antitoxin component of RelBE/YafQ-DinJ toxin-antitoxin module